MLVRLILLIFCLAMPGAFARAQDQVGDARECTAPGQTGCERALVITGGRCQAIAGDPGATWSAADIDRFTNACWTCDDLDMDFRFGESLGFFRCQKRFAASALPQPPVPDWQQRECTRYALVRDTPDSVTLRIRNLCGHEIAVNACAVWYDGREQAERSTTAARNGEAALSWPVERYTTANVTWNYCRTDAEVPCPAPCPR